MRTRLTIFLLALCLAAPATAEASKVVTIASGQELGFGPSARLKGWRDTPRARLCLWLYAPYETDSERSAIRRFTCLPYPARRALTLRSVDHECGLGVLKLFGIARSDVARIQLEYPNSVVDLRTFRVPRLVGADTVFFDDYGNDNVLTAHAADGSLLKRLSWFWPERGCPIQRHEWL